MPRRVPTTRRRVSSELEEGLAELLLSGSRSGAPYSRFISKPWRRTDAELDHLAEAWAAHGSRLVEAWVGVYPGSRPWGWWEFDAPERRRIVEVRVRGRLAVPSSAPACIAQRRHEFGVVAAWWGDGWPEWVSVVYETEHAYLERHGFLSADEVGEVDAVVEAGLEDPRTEGWGAHVNRHAFMVLAAMGFPWSIAQREERAVQRTVFPPLPSVPDAHSWPATLPHPAAEGAPS